MDSADKTRKIFLIGTVVLGILIIAGLIWAVTMGPGETGSNLDPNLVFNDEGAPTTGPDDAKVTVRIYSDFQCPACMVAEIYLEDIISQYKDRVRFVWNDFPLSSIHRNAVSAAVAARCAQEQSKFWEYKTALYASQDDWSDLINPAEQYQNIAGQLGLNEDGFSRCLADVAVRNKVEKDYSEALSLGLDATPTFIVNRKKISGAIDDAQWKQELDALLDQ